MLACSFLGQLRPNDDLEDDTLHLSIAGSFSSSLMPAETRIHRATISATEFSADDLPVITKSLEADAAPSRKRWGILAFIHVFILKLKCKVRRRKSSQEGLVHEAIGLSSSADVEMRPTTAHSWANVGYHGHEPRGSKFEMVS
uniref:Uncharacterized protein n=1 Tax=Plectus sambesii TaxID=2011161 RepID=A0A914UZY3_9BILA